MWSPGEKNYGSFEHPCDQPLSLKKVTTTPLEKVTFLHFFFYVNVDYTPQTEMKVIPSEGAAGPEEPMDVDSAIPATTAANDPGTSSAGTEVPPASMGTEEDMEGRKRKGPETRTVILAPEAKRSRVSSLVHLVNSEKVWRIGHNASSSTSTGSCAGRRPSPRSSHGVVWLG